MRRIGAGNRGVSVCEGAVGAVLVTNVAPSIADPFDQQGEPTNIGLSRAQWSETQARTVVVRRRKGAVVNGLAIVAETEKRRPPH